MLKNGSDFNVNHAEVTEKWRRNSDCYRKGGTRDRLPQACGLAQKINLIVHVLQHVLDASK
jgi:hypothetical protein